MWDSAGPGLSSGARTPRKLIQNNARQALVSIPACFFDLPLILVALGSFARISL